MSMNTHCGIGRFGAGRYGDFPAPAKAPQPANDDTRQQG